LLIFIKHNTDPVVRGAGSCVLLHVWSRPGSPTQGCTAMELANLKTLVSWLRPQSHPVLVQAPAEAIEQHAADWGIPR
jgi:D-alanyl-D-alanine dipeptidase